VAFLGRPGKSKTPKTFGHSDILTPKTAKTFGHSKNLDVDPQKAPPFKQFSEEKLL
jgi:hypothetical protein